MMKNSILLKVLTLVGVTLLASSGWGFETNVDSEIKEADLTISKSSNTSSNDRGGDLTVQGNLAVDGNLTKVAGGNDLPTTDTNALKITTSNNSVNNAVEIAKINFTPTATGKRVLLMATGHGNPDSTNGGWYSVQLSRKIGSITTAIGKIVVSQTDSQSHNQPFTLLHLDAPNTVEQVEYTVKAWSGVAGTVGGNWDFAEGVKTDSSDRALYKPTIIALEL